MKGVSGICSPSANTLEMAKKTQMLALTSNVITIVAPLLGLFMRVCVSSCGIDELSVQRRCLSLPAMKICAFDVCMIPGLQGLIRVRGASVEKMSLG